MQNENVLFELEASSHLKISPTSLRRDRVDGRLGGIPFVRLGGRIVYLREALDEWLAAKQQRVVAVVKEKKEDVARRGRPTKAEQIEAARRGISVRELRSGVAA